MMRLREIVNIVIVCLAVPQPKIVIINLIKTVQNSITNVAKKLQCMVIAHAQL